MVGLNRKCPKILNRPETLKLHKILRNLIKVCSTTLKTVSVAYVNFCIDKMGV